MMAQALFLRGTLDKLKIVPEYYHIAEYKTASNLFTEKKFTPAHKEEVEGLLHGIYDQYLTDASKGRGMDRAKFEALVNRGPLSSSEAVERSWWTGWATGTSCRTISPSTPPAGGLFRSRVTASSWIRPHFRGEENRDCAWPPA